MSGRLKGNAQPRELGLTIVSNECDAGVEPVELDFLLRHAHMGSNPALLCWRGPDCQIEPEIRSKACVTSPPPPFLPRCVP